MTEPQVRQWLERTARPLAGVEAGQPSDDLEPLGALLSGVRVVGLGEATHGTREFFQLKHRLLEYLVTELGYRTLAMEASESAGLAVDAYVRDGSGDAKTVVSGLGFWTWRTEEVVAMVEWMRRYNQGRPTGEQVGFAGVDPQKCSLALAVIREHLAATAPERLDLFDDGIAAEVDRGPGQAPDPRGLLVRETDALGGFLLEHGAPAGVLAAAAQLVRSAELVSASPRDKDPAKTAFAVRDRLMAEAVADLLTAEDAKVVLWAHNGHLAAGRQDPTLRPLGKHLREQYGEAYYAVALLCGSGSFRARRMWPGPWSRPGDGPVVDNSLDRGGFTSLEGQLSAANPGDHFLDLRSAGDAPPEVRKWLDAPHMFRSFGAYIQRWTYRFQFTPTQLLQEYDALAYVATTSPSRPLADG